MNNILYTFHVTTIFSLLLSGIFIVSIRGFNRPILFMSLNRFISVAVTTLIMFQTLHLPIYGRILWNPLIIITILTVNPLLFAYIFGMLRPGAPGIRFWLWTYLPTAVLVMLFLTFEAHYGKLPLVSKYSELRNYLNMPQLWILFAGTGFSGALISVYTVRAIGMLRRHKRALKSNFSCTEGCTLGWMWWAICLTLFKWLILITGITLEGQTSAMAGVLFFTVEPVIIAVLVIRQKDLYRPPAAKEKNAVDSLSEYRQDYPELSPEKRNALQKHLLRLLHEEEVYKNPELCCDKLCEMLNTNRSCLSLIINKDMKTTFYGLINNRRLEKSKELMKNPDYRDMPLATVAELSGFKSPVIFSRIFKQTNEMTPKEWRKEALQAVNKLVYALPDN
jgi:AraC-like DNA-binding protein